jgi:polysaccharide biosynthesis protein PelF
LLPSEDTQSELIEIPQGGPIEATDPSHPTADPNHLTRFRAPSDTRTPGPTRILLITEGTYPFIVGGVSTWCDALIAGLEEFEFEVLPITAGGVRREALFTLPANASLAGHLDLWSEDVPVSVPSLRRDSFEIDLPSALARGLLDWNGNFDSFVEALLWCRRNPRRIRPAFRRKGAWNEFVYTLTELSKDSGDEYSPAPEFDMMEVSELYRLLWWVARSAAYPTPDGAHAPDLLMVTAAGWATIPAVVHKLIHGTPILLTEHGIYVREAYLAAIRNEARAASRWISARVARGLSRLAYQFADRVSPVTGSNAIWEESFGVDRELITTIYNGVVVPSKRQRPPCKHLVVAVGRIDPLKDNKTMLRTAARVLETMPSARFVHYGPIPAENAKYAAEVMRLHEELGLGDRFVFAGSTEDPYGVVARSDVALLTSISEGSPITVLEAMASGRPVVATAVGGVPEAVRGCGFTARPGDHESLAVGLLRLLEDADLAENLGLLAYKRAAEVFAHSGSLEKYRMWIRTLSGLDQLNTDMASNPNNAIEPTLVLNDAQRRQTHSSRSAESEGVKSAGAESERAESERAESGNNSSGNINV